ncbi:MAG: hypothetical protein C3F06_00215 [Candidatus Methanoperedenaceae archaeon]|nr:MAG: hypothetical protein C3F06_00215 [Candidatus Methanoperedenaceae archaeon]
MKPKKIILIIIDSLRKDHLGCYGYERNTSPNIDALAESGILFKHAFSVCSNTVPSIASILTSKHPDNHSIGFDPEGKLNAQAERTLASILKENNYRTSAFSGCQGLSGLNPGFDIFDDAKERRNCHATNEKIFSWLDVNHMHDFFMFVHYFDAHVSYISPESYKNMFLKDEFYGSPEYNPNLSDKNDIRYYKAQYDGCIRFIDDNIGKFIEKLRKLSIYEDSLIFITSDHGVSFGENNVFLENGLSVTLDQIAVPLIIKPHKGIGIKPGERNIHISNIDIMPTILSLYDYEYKEVGLEGHSLKTILEDKKDVILEERTLTCENEYQFALIYSNKLMEIKKKDSLTGKNYPINISLIDALNGKKYYWDSGQEYYMSISFDQYQRYRLISDIINKFRNDKKTFKILDVGASFEENLKKFLPCDDIYYLDKDYPPEYKQRTNFIIGDITKLELDETYDFVISVDTYEHVPANFREKFINNLLHLSRIATIIAAPFDTPGVRENEILANELYKLSHGTEYVWLHEHIQNGLPSLPFTIELVKKSRFKYAVIPNGYLPRWFEMISTFLLTEGMPEFSKSIEELNEFYNKNFYLLDNLNPAYRQAIIIIKNDTKMDFSDIHANDPKSDKEFSIKYEMLQSFIKNIKDFYSNQRYKELKDKELKGKDIELKEKANAIQVRDIQINELKSTIQSKDTHISGLNTALQTRDVQISGLNTALQTRDVQISGLNDALKDIHQSVTWRTVKKFHTVIERLFPQETGRRKLYDLGIKGMRSIVNVGFKQTISNFNEYWHSGKKIKIADNDESSGISNITKYNKGSRLDKQYTLDLFNRASKKSPEYVALSQTNINLTENDIKLIAFYLPQYHPIPENDQWWGKGFTDWRNVAKAVPQFNGHYQPRLPDELGFYDLRLIEVMKRQIELAHQYGIYGFCFHYYWFNGKKLLETPLNQFLKNPELDIKFCICWANENWTRRWDGLDNEILIAQTHSIENDLAFIKDLEPFFRDPRYIKIDGKPVLIVYRVMLLPDAKKTAERWREYCKKQGIGDIYLVAAQSFGFVDPQPYGFDAAVEFPPHTLHDCRIITNKIKVLNPDFSGNILDFKDFVKSNNYLKITPYKLFKTVSPGWDNTARKPKNAAIFYGSNPETYKQWLSNVAKFSRNVHKKEERFVFINAWNEWAEGAYLEPDIKYGYGYLQATSEVILEYRSNTIESRKVIFVSHDANYNGAQLISLNIIKNLKDLFKYNIYLILKSGGPLETEFQKHSTVYNIEKDFISLKKLEDLIQELRSNGADIAICNTVVSGDYIELFNKYNIKTISLIHELPGIIKDYRMEKNAEIIAQYADTIIFPSEYVKSKFATLAKLDEKKCIIAPQGLYLRNNFKEKREEAKIALRKLLSILPNSKIILGVGYADFRKGIDLFVQIAKNVIQSDSTSYFVWVGQYDNNFMKNVFSDIKKSGLENNIRFVGLQKEPSLFYAGSDIYLMTSREDPFPSTVLEAMDVEVPIIGFMDAGGFKDIVNENTGILVPYLDINEMTKAVISLLNDPKRRDNLGKNASELISKKYNFIDYVYFLLSLFGHEYKKVSVVIPNYNYEKYLEERIFSIFDQTYPVYEILFLDDCSSDNSMECAKNLTKNCTIPVKIISNKVNSGSAFKQWEKGIKAARGDYVWIAEADDFCDKRFLDRLIPAFSDPEVVLAYSQSAPVDEKGHLYMPDYRSYTADLSETRWNSAYTNKGIDEIRDYLSIKNTIPNASAVVFRRKGVTIPEGIHEFRFVGDWFFYINLLLNGKIAFVPDVLNFHRRHGETVTNKNELDERAIIEQLKVKTWIIEQIKLPTNRIAPCVAHVVSEYHRLGELHNLSRPRFMKNPVLIPWVERLRESVSNVLLQKKSQKCLLIVIGDAEVGGGQIAAVRLANQWSKDHRIFLCNARPEAIDTQFVNRVSPDIVFLEGILGRSEWSKGARSTVHLNSRISETPRRIDIVRDLIEFYRIDIIMSHIWWADRFVFAVNGELRIPWFIQMHGCYEALAAHPEWDPEFKKLAPMIMQLATGLCYSSSKNLAIFEKGLAPKPALLRQFNNGLDPSSIPNSINGPFERNVNDFIFCLCSRAIPEKGWEEAINATLQINELRSEMRRGKKANLWLIGDGEYAQTLGKKYAKYEEIEFKGLMQDPLPAIFLCDIGLLPSRFVSESMPSTVIEYLACGKPVIATTMGSIPEMIVCDGRKAGLLIQHDLTQKLFEEALKEAMLRYLRDQALLEEHKRNARIIFNAQFDLENVAQQYLSFFSEAISNLSQKKE